MLLLALLQLVKPMSKILLISIPAGLALFCVYALLYASFSTVDLPKDIFDEIVRSEIFGQEVTLDPKSIANFFLNVWVLPSVVFAGFATLKTYGLQRCTKLLSDHPHAMRLLSSLWMQESELGDYYLLVNFGLRSGRRRAGRRRRRMRRARYGERLKRLFRVGYRLCCVVGQFTRYVEQLGRLFRARNICLFLMFNPCRNCSFL